MIQTFEDAIGNSAVTMDVASDEQNHLAKKIKQFTNSSRL